MRVLTRLLGITALLLTGCSGISVNHDYDTDADFSQLKTWQWAASNTGSNHPLTNSDLVDERVRNSVSSALAAKGLNPVNDAPDLLVDYQIVLEQPAPVAQEPRISIGMGASSGGSSYGGVGFRFGDSGQSSPHEILIIDMKNPATGKLLWRGSSRRIMKSDNSPTEASERMNETVNAILAEFPPKP